MLVHLTNPNLINQISVHCVRLSHLVDHCVDADVNDPILKCLTMNSVIVSFDRQPGKVEGKIVEIKWDLDLEILFLWSSSNLIRNNTNEVSINHAMDTTNGSLYLSRFKTNLFLQDNRKMFFICFKKKCLCILYAFGVFHFVLITLAQFSSIFFI